MIKTEYLPEQWDFYVYPGDHWPPVIFGLYDELNVPCSNYTVKQYIFKYIGIEEFVKINTEEDGFISEDNKRALNGLNPLPAGKYLHDVKVELASGRVVTIFYGQINVVHQTGYKPKFVTEKKVIIPGANAGSTEENSSFPYTFTFNF